MRTIIILCCIFISGCGINHISGVKDGAPAQPIANITNIPNAVPQQLPLSKYGNPNSYIVNGITYHVLKTAYGYDKKGIASWYGTKFHGRLTSTRTPYNMYAMTAASRTLPLPTFVRVTNLENGKWIIVKVNDRGPFVDNRIIDLSYAAATKLGYVQRGTALVEVKAIEPSSVTPNLPQSGRTITLHRPKLYLQIGAFSNQINAVNLSKRINQITTAGVHVKPASVNNHPIYRVQIGPLVDVAESDQLQQLLRTQGIGEAFTVIS